MDKQPDDRDAIARKAHDPARPQRPRRPPANARLRRRHIHPAVSSERPRGARVWRFEDIFGGTEVVTSLGPAFER